MHVTDENQNSAEKTYAIRAVERTCDILDTLGAANAPVTLTDLARLGFTELGSTRDRLRALPGGILPLFARAADADQSLRLLGELLAVAPTELGRALGNQDAADRLIRVLGASRGLGEFLLRHPEELAALAEPLPELPDRDG